MVSRKDRIIVVDVERTCWENDKAPEGQKSEIIQIGYTFLNPLTLEISQPHEILIRPQRSKISEYCTNLTGLTWDRVKRGIVYQDAVKYFMKQAATRSCVWAGWGQENNDFIHQSADFNAIYPFGDNYLNIQDMYWMMFGTAFRPQLKRSVEELGLIFEGRWHDGKDDSYNTARVLREMLERGRSQESKVVKLKTGVTNFSESKAIVICPQDQVWKHTYKKGE